MKKLTKTPTVRIVTTSNLRAACGGYLTDVAQPKSSSDGPKTAPGGNK